MNTEYCIKCGGKAEFSVSKPKFCPTCGSPFNRAASSVSKASFNEEEEEYEDDASEYVDVQSLKRKNIFKAEVNKDFKVTIADLAPPSPESSKASRQSKRGEESLSGEEIIRKMQMECSRIKTSTTIGE
jgi:hypothetical protein